MHTAPLAQLENIPWNKKNPNGPLSSAGSDWSLLLVATVQALVSAQEMKRNVIQIEK